jgi:NAD(P)-dependent dehydrogenase (short-subunit alcohol dehydrogenase family)
VPAPDILVTNAGGPASTDFRSLNLQDWRGALDANFLSATELIRAVADGMIQRRFGRIVNIISLTVRMEFGAACAFLCAAARVERLSRSAGTALSYKTQGVAPMCSCIALLR